MNNEEIIRKLSHNKLLLYLVPNFIYLIVLFHYYNVNFLGMLEVTFAEIVFISSIFFIITNILYLILLKILKDRQKVFIIMTFICAFYNINLGWKFLIGLLLFIIILVIEFKVIFKFKLDRAVFIIGFMISVMFLYNAVGVMVNLGTMIVKSKEYEQEVVINLDDDDTPNIYYIHCDGMMSFDGIEEYFGYNNIYLKDYLKDYYINSSASLVAGHRTQRALVALFNPKYYDSFFNDYLKQLEDTYLGKKDTTDYYIDYYELEEKRFNNELFKALEKKGYTTIGIGEYNAYTSFDMDYYYDYFNSYKDDEYMDIENSQLRLIKNDIDSFSRKLYIRFSNNKKILKRTILSDLLVSYIPLNYKEIDYKSFDTSEYTYINSVYENNNYWTPKAIIKSLSESIKLGDKRFTFIDFNMNHDPYLFDMHGNVMGEESQWYIGSYLGNYIYSSYILTDILEYIKSMDSDSVIVVQGDHGLHTAEYSDMNKYFNVSIEDAQDIRNSVISAIYVPKKYQNGEEQYLNNPLNISRYIVNNFVGDNYEYLIEE